MKFRSSTVQTTNKKLEVGKHYIYKESLPYCLLLFRLDDIKKGDPVYGDNWVTLEVTILKSDGLPLTEEKKDTWGFCDGETGYYPGMWRIFDEGTYCV